MSFKIEGDTLRWCYHGKTTVLFQEGSDKWPVLCGFRAVNINDVSDMVFRKDFSCKAEIWFKYALLFAIFLDNPDDEKTCAYIKKNFSKIFAYYIHADKTEAVKALLDSGKFITKRNIDKWIQYAIDNQKHEIQVMLTSHKAKNNWYDDDEKTIKKKFRL